MKKRDELLKLARLSAFSDYKAVISELKQILDKKYQSVNERILNGLNPHIGFDKDKDSRFQITTPALDEKETKHLAL